MAKASKIGRSLAYLLVIFKRMSIVDWDLLVRTSPLLPEAKLPCGLYKQEDLQADEDQSLLMMNKVMVK